jgi:protein SCO1/2
MTPPAPSAAAGRGGRVIALALVLAAVCACGRGEPPPVLGTLPPFALTERSGATIGADDLRGRVWIAGFIFTRCPDVCPALTRRLGELQAQLAGGVDPVQLVALSVDPGHDTPEVLREYAERHGAGPHWWFLTGSRDAIVRLLRDGFRVAFADDGPPTAPITHSDRFVLVDRGMRIRGYYRGSDPADLARLQADARRVRDEPAG